MHPSPELANTTDSSSSQVKRRNSVLTVEEEGIGREINITQYHGNIAALLSLLDSINW